MVLLGQSTRLFNPTIRALWVIDWLAWLIYNKTFQAKCFIIIATDLSMNFAYHHSMCQPEQNAPLARDFNDGNLTW